MNQPRIYLDRYAAMDVEPRHGGTSVVIQGRDIVSGNEVAIKIVDVSKAGDAGREMVQREIGNLQELSDPSPHRNIVRFYDFDYDATTGKFYIVLEWIHDSLDKALADVRYEGWTDFQPVMLGLASGLAEMHSKKVMHRDIKPANVLLTNGGVAKYADLGISKALRTVGPLVSVLAGYQTLGYAPPEIDRDIDPRDPIVVEAESRPETRDIYSLGATAIAVLVGKEPRSRADLIELLAALDVPEGIDSVLRSCVARSPSERPGSAKELINLLEVEIGALSAMSRNFEALSQKIYIGIAKGVIESVAARMSLDWDEARAFVVRDLNDDPAVSMSPSSHNGPAALQVIGQVFSFRVVEHANAQGQLAVIGAGFLPSHVLENLRGQSWAAPVSFVDERVPSQKMHLAEDGIRDLWTRVSEHESDRLIAEKARIAHRSFDVWSSLLTMREEIDRDRAMTIRFKSWERAGRDVEFIVADTDASDELLGVLFKVHIGNGPPVRGEIVEVITGAITLEVRDGDLGKLPAAGMLEYDIDLSKTAVRRQRTALEQIRTGAAVRSDLGGLLSDPATSIAVELEGDIRYQNKSLDASKQKAIRAALATRDFCVVSGPPGTGKTSFITELVYQTIERNPRARILIASQTHVALDNALERVRASLPAVKLLRVGRKGAHGPELDELRLENQISLWKDCVIERSRDYLKAVAKELGINVSDVDAAEMLSRIATSAERLTRARSSLKRQQDERSILRQRIADAGDLAASLMSVAQQIEDVLARNSDESELGSAAAVFLEQGVQLAAELDQGSRLADQLLQRESAISNLAIEAREAELSDLKARGDAAHQLGAEFADSPPTAAELGAMASKVSSPDQEPYKSIREIQSAWRDRVDQSSDFAAAVVLDAQVIGATCIGFAGVPGVADIEFDLCIVDEASKATATETFVPMVRSKRWVMVGDNRQLPPFMERELLDLKRLAKNGLEPQDAEHTLFDHLSEHLPSDRVIHLKEQHRMVPAIGDLISDCFYDGELTSSRVDSNEMLESILGSAAVWVSTSKLAGRRETQLGTSYSNNAEAQLIKALVQRIDENAARDGVRLTVAVLSGYSPQRDQIHRLLQRIVLEAVAIEVNTIDAFQGRESDVVIVSMTRSNTRGEVGFLASDRRLNVALSRGRDALVVVGDADFFVSTGRDNAAARVLNHMLDPESAALVATPEQIGMVHS